MKRLLPAFAWDRPVTVFMLFLGLALFGVISYLRIPIQMFPSGFETSSLWVGVGYPNASPAEIDREIVSVIDEQLSTVVGIESIESSAGGDRATFSISFHGSADMDVGYNAVVDRMERALVRMPDDVEDYWIYKFNPDDTPILWVGVTLPDETSDAHHILEKVVRPRLERIPGVANLDVWGVNERAVYVDYNRDAVMSYGVDLGALTRRLQADNFQSVGGKLKERGELSFVRSMSQFERVEDIARYPVKEGIVLADIAEVSMRLVGEGSINRLNSRNAAGIGIKKESSANTVAVTEAVEAAMRELEADPATEGVTFFTFFSQGEMITSAVDNLTNTAMLGGLFAIMVLYLFLREWRMTLLIATAIPFSLLLTISVQYLMGDTLNLLTMMGLMLAIGMAVDNAIVVVETIVTRRAAGDAPRVATVEGTASVNLAITMSTLTTMVVFLPIMVMTQEAEFSFFLRILGFAVMVTLGASLFVALVFAPFATRFFPTGAPRPEPKWLTLLTKIYRGLLSKLLTRRVDSLYGLAAMLLLTVVLPVRGVECSGADGNVMNDFSIRFTVPRVASMQERDEIVQVFEDLVDENMEAWGVGGYRSRLEADSTRGRITVYLDPSDGKDRDEIVKAARAILPTEMPGVVSRIGWEGGEGSDSARVTLLGENIDTLDNLADEVIRRLETQPEVMSAMRSHEIKGQEEIRLYVDETAAERAGLNAAGVAQTVSYAMRGTQLEPLVEGEREVPVVTRFRLEDRGSIEALGDFGVWSPQLFQMVPVRALTNSEVARGPYEIRRSDGVAGLQIQADFVSGTPYRDRSAIVGAALTPMEFPYGYSWDGSQGFQMPDAEFATAIFAVTLSLIFVFLLMGMLFESVVLPMSVIMTVPMAAVGAFWGLYLTDTPLDAMAMVGLVILVGVVVNNGIVLVDLVTQLRAEGLARDQALIDAGARRFRPILMTALTTICGLIPMAVGSSTFVGLPYAPLGRIVIGGLASATLLTVFFIPVLYALLDDARSLGSPFLSFVFKKRSQ